MWLQRIYFKLNCLIIPSSFQIEISFLSGKSPLPFKPSSSSSTDCKSTSIAIREATTKLTSASKSSSEADVKDLLRRPKIDLPSPSSSRNASSSRDSPLPNRKQLPDLPFKTNDKNKNGKNFTL